MHIDFYASFDKPTKGILRLQTQARNSKCMKWKEAKHFNNQRCVQAHFQLRYIFLKGGKSSSWVGRGAVVGLNEFLQMQKAEMTASRLTAFELKQTHEHLKVQFLSVST